MDDEPPLKVAPSKGSAFFQGVDWLAFGLTTWLALTIYCLTLTPELDLDHSGIFTTGAMYPGVTEPPGHPLWALYGWGFIQLWPFGNIAWRLALASALAGAVTCGLIALVVSRVGWMLVKASTKGQSWPVRERICLRAGCGMVAGLAWGLDGCAWRQMVRPETWSLEWLLFALTLCLTIRWLFAPERRRWLYAAAFAGGLSLSESQALAPAIWALPFLVAAGDRKVGRDLILAGVFIFYETMVHWPGSARGQYGGGSVFSWVFVVTLVAVMVWAVGGRKFFSGWKPAAFRGRFILYGLGACFLIFTGIQVAYGVCEYIPNFSGWRDLATDFLRRPSALEWLTGTALVTGLALAIRARGIFLEWKAMAVFFALIFAGLGAYLLLPAYSLTNPPMNWGYPRTVEGFNHVLGRDQFERMELTRAWPQLGMQLGLYLESVRDDFGALYLMLAWLPFLRLRAMDKAVRNWLVGLLVFELMLVLLTLMGLNLNRVSAAYSKPYFAPAHWVMALFAGCGLMLAGAWFAGGTARPKP